MKNKPLVSIIIPAYNVERYLKKCVDSILSQTYKKCEIIIVDDGSVDKTGDVADSYGRKYKTIKVVHKKNGGLSSARNAGIEIASGEWLAFVDSDDYVENVFIEKLVNAALKNGADIATCSFEPFTNDNSPLKKSPTWPDGVMSGVDSLNDMLKNKRPAYICLNLFKKDLFLNNNISFPMGCEFEDIATKVKLLSVAKKVTYLNENLYYYLIRKDSITGKSFNKKRHDDYLKAISDARAYISNSIFMDEIVYLDYFEFYSLITLFNYMAREWSSSNETMRQYWKSTRKRIKELYRITRFPSLKQKMVGAVVVRLSLNAPVYSKIYKRIKK